MVPLILEPLLLKGNDENIVVITFQNKVFHNVKTFNEMFLKVVITLQNRAFHNFVRLQHFNPFVVITLQNKVFHNNKLLNVTCT